MQKVPEVVVNERVSQGKSVKKKPKDKKKVPGWSTEEMQERPNFAVEEDTEEMKKWRDLNQSEIDTCWKKLAERMEEEVLDKCKVEESKRGPLEAEVTPWNGEEYAKKKKKKTRDIKLESGEKTAGQ